MIYRTIHGTRLPALGFGTWDLRGDAGTDSVADALAIGYRHIDTAQGYDNEAQVGAALRRSGVPRDEIFLVTKVRPDNFRADDAVSSSRASLRKLGVDHVDLLLLHWPNPDVPLEETLGALRGLQDEGAVRHLGVSNFPPSLVEEARAHADIFANQVEYHPFLHQRPLLAQADAFDYLLTAYSPIAQGAVMDDATMQEIADAHGKSPTQVALRWLLQQDRVAAIPRSSSHEHRVGNFDVFDFELSDDEMAAIHGLEREQRLVDPDDGPEWERG